MSDRAYCHSTFFMSQTAKSLPLPEFLIQFLESHTFCIWSHGNKQWYLATMINPEAPRFSCGEQGDAWAGGYGRFLLIEFLVSLLLHPPACFPETASSTILLDKMLSSVLQFNYYKNLYLKTSRNKN